VNSASIFKHDQLEDLQEAVFLEHMRVNLFAPMELSSGLLKHVQARRKGGETIDHGAVCIVNLLDQKLANTNPDHLSYTMSKYGYVFSHMYPMYHMRFCLCSGNSTFHPFVHHPFPLTAHTHSNTYTHAHTHAHTLPHSSFPTYNRLQGLTDTLSRSMAGEGVRVNGKMAHLAHTLTPTLQHYL
jgi:hypothetical protein